jgi:hypothetical protein
MDNVGYLIDTDSGGSFFGELFATITGVHLSFGEIATFEFEVDRVDGHKPCKKYTFYLHGVVKSVSKDETALFYTVTVKVTIEKQTIFFSKVGYKLLYSEDHRLLLWVRIFVMPVEVVMEDIHSVMT